jgi:DNA (cytosine-5)-methyltransferase 1
MRSIELFAGAGGLALGTGRAGFGHDLVAEWNPEACETLRGNRGRVREMVSWSEIYEGDVRNLDYRKYQDRLDLVAGGPPCQPFSLGGKHRAYLDDRDMFPEAVRAVRESRPKAFIFENVKGLLRQSFSTYFEYIILQLNYPDVVRRGKETWQDHLRRLERIHTRGKHDGLRYNVVFNLINAANQGVPQRRERVFIVGFRSDLGLRWSFPKATHSKEALLKAKWVTGEYWERHRVAKTRRGAPPKELKRTIEAIDGNPNSILSPWRTVRDAISDLPAPGRSNPTFSNHLFVPGARVYPGHTGSPLDEPAKTLKAGAHGVPGGENMLAMPDGSVRYFTVRESARIQTFPDDYEITGAWTECMRQLGNAVPVELGQAVAGSVAAELKSTR